MMASMSRLSGYPELRDSTRLHWHMRHNLLIWNRQRGKQLLSSLHAT